MLNQNDIKGIICEEVAAKHLMQILAMAGGQRGMNCGIERIGAEYLGGKLGSVFPDAGVSPNPYDRATFDWVTAAYRRAPDMLIWQQDARNGTQLKFVECKYRSINRGNFPAYHCYTIDTDEMPYASLGVEPQMNALDDMITSLNIHVKNNNGIGAINLFVYLMLDDGKDMKAYIGRVYKGKKLNHIDFYDAETLKKSKLAINWPAFGLLFERVIENGRDKLLRNAIEYLSTDDSGSGSFFCKKSHAAGVIRNILA